MDKGIDVGIRAIQQPAIDRPVSQLCDGDCSKHVERRMLKERSHTKLAQKLPSSSSSAASAASATTTTTTTTPVPATHFIHSTASREDISKTFFCAVKAKTAKQSDQHLEELKSLDHGAGEYLKKFKGKGLFQWRFAEQGCTTLDIYHNNPSESLNHPRGTTGMRSTDLIEQVSLGLDMQGGVAGDLLKVVGALEKDGIEIFPYVQTELDKLIALSHEFEITHDQCGQMYTVAHIVKKDSVHRVNATARPMRCPCNPVLQ